MSTTSRRRNGSQASCERCRKAKIRCDHQKPVCAPCRRRGLESQCWYHPAPLTKRRGQQKSTPPRPTSTQLNNIEQNEITSNVSPHRNIIENESLEETPKFQTWPFILNDTSNTASRTLLYESLDKKTYEEYLTFTEEIILQLKFLPLVERLFQEYLPFRQVSLVPRPIILQLVASIRSSPITKGYVGEDVTRCSDGLSRLAEAVLCAASSEISVKPDLDLEQFCELFSGENLCLETLGLLYTTAARCYLCGIGRDEKEHAEFIREMIRCSNLSLRIARELSTQTNDIINWLAYENLQLMMLIEGDASLSVWRRFGDLVTDVFALGLHREAVYSVKAVPFFLSECRRGIFVTAYYIDKVFAMVFNRPPRIPIRHADCKLPLDLSEDELFATSPEVLERARGRLSPAGWSTDGNYKTRTWARIRYILAGFREEMVEYQFRSVQSVDEIYLRGILNRCNNAWSSLPKHLIYNRDCWRSNLPSAVCLMLGKVYLAYLHTIFQLHRLLQQGSTSHKPELIEVSKNMLETVVQMTNAQSRFFRYPHSIPTVILFYGVPSAAILTSVLLDVTRNPSRALPPSISGSVLIRNLSVLASHLESATSPGETNHEFCMQAANLISRNLDQILGGFIISTVTTPLDPAEELDNVSDVWAPGTSDLDAISFGGFDSLDFETWAMDINLNAISSEWNIQ
ncbi:hypothetical protein F5Y00DRAFT_262570 [Daldinia vernicosa]|uniref:uncharacterized protein n=1 Tax=Daldinia vernicosa TaxID=114800 RepID=UPI0020081532|nr:uncharacterized protein F5Y00DRAFT_262570 [Daldinia vernicosa]KAI0848475.1 hypothetical protein F5Y00DRAFT_262570 [Daldinia vernicosa]